MRARDRHPFFPASGTTLPLLLLLVLSFSSFSAGAFRLRADDEPASARDEAWRAHWAFQPIRDPLPPVVDRSEAVRTPVDRFILRKLAEHGIEPPPAADRRTLIRRLTFDLTGLPPAPDEIDAFLADDRPDAWERLTERLLASPRYGERWARHWLDVARYADTRGYVFQSERKYAYSYTYRDYVIRVFNEGKPFDRFIVEQIAADKLDLAKDPEPYAAMGFLTLGRRFLNNTHDIIDDRIDVVTRGLMGFTVQCARCHDHKYDPIPTSDYYSLYNVFANSVEPDELPLTGEPEKTQEYESYQRELAKKEKAYEDFVATKTATILDELRREVGRYLLAAREVPADSEAGVSVGEKEIKPRAVERWREFLAGSGGRDHPVFGPWHELGALPVERFAGECARLVESWSRSAAGSRRVNPVVLEAFRAAPPRTLEEAAEVYTRIFQEIEEEWECSQVSDPPPKRLADDDREELRLVLHGDGSPLAISSEEIFRFFDRATRGTARDLKKAIDSLRANSTAAPPRGMVLVDRSDLVDGRIFERGNPRRPGDPVSRHFLTALSAGKPQPFTDGSGRIELARAIVDPKNPLTARVLANRIWLWHFGEGLVSTPSDFGMRSDPPSHPELLDWLASRLIESGWSIKELHWLILGSATYRQSAVHPRGDELTRLDPENRLLWKAPARRLEFESLRDSLLAVSDRLDRSMGGAAVELFAEPYPTRRTIYGFIERQNLPGVLRVFDFASPDATCPKRHETTVPQQALWLLNSDFAIEQAKSFVRRPDFAEIADPAARIRFAYETIYGREPESAETELGLAFTKDRSETEEGGGGTVQLDRWERYVHALLCSNEFQFID